MHRLVLPAAAALVLAQAQAADLTAAAAPCPPAAAPKVAFVFEGAPQALPAHLAALRAVSAQLGPGGCVRSFDHLSSGVDAEANVRFLLGSLGLERYALVFLLTPRHGEVLGKVARQFPQTTYLQLDGRSSAANVVPYRLQGKGLRSFYRAIMQCAVAGGRPRGEVGQAQGHCRPG